MKYRNPEIPATQSEQSTPPCKAPSWRTVVPIHPAAETDPLMTKAQQRELGESIRKNGLRFSVTTYDDSLLDGRNRLDGLELIGVELLLWAPPDGEEPGEWIFDLDAALKKAGIEVLCGTACTEYHCGDIDPWVFAGVANHDRRHMVPEAKVVAEAKLKALTEAKLKAIEEALKATREKPDRQIAEETGTSPTTVGKVRKRLEDAGLLSTVDTRTDRRGARRKAHNKGNRGKTGSTKTANKDSNRPNVTPPVADNGGDPGASAERQKSRMAAMADPDLRRLAAKMRSRREGCREAGRVWGGRRR
jgi:DNA-binding transcriptional ArsR family regulator